MSTTFGDLMVVRPTGEDEFRAEPPGSGFLYGGMTMGLAVSAAGLAAPDGLVPMSLRCQFLTFGELGPMRIVVERLHSTRSFAIERVSLRQGDEDRLVAAAEVTFHRPEEGADHQHHAAADVPLPDELPTTEGVRFGADFPVDPFDLRAAHDRAPASQERFHPFWARSREPLPDSPAAHDAALAFLSDYLVINSPFEPGTGHGEGMRSYTLEHTLWFHRAINAHSWMLFDCEPLTWSGGRYTSRGTVHDEPGALLASFAQVGFVRPVRR